MHMLCFHLLSISMRAVTLPIFLTTLSLCPMQLPGMQWVLGTYMLNEVVDEQVPLLNRYIFL